MWKDEIRNESDTCSELIYTVEDFKKDLINTVADSV